MSKLNPIDGLIRYITNDVKPFHTKIIEVLVEYDTTDKLKASVKEDLQIEVGIGGAPLTSRYKYAISGILSPNTLAISAISSFPSYLDIALLLPPGTTVSISGSTSGDDLQTNDGTYYIVSAVPDLVNHYTILTLDTPIPTTSLQPVSLPGYVQSARLGFICVTPIEYQLINKKAATTNVARVRPCETGFGQVFDPQTGNTIYDVMSDPNAPYPILDANSVSNYFILAGDQVLYFPYGREFTVDLSTNSGRYNVLQSTLESDGRTKVYVVQDILNNFPSNQTQDGNITTPGAFGGQYLYSYGLDGPNLCSQVPFLSVDASVVDQLDLQAIDEYVAPVGWDDRPWDRTGWDNKRPSRFISLEGYGYDPDDGYDIPYDT